MRPGGTFALVAALAPALASADDGASARGLVGAGGQGDAAYSAVEVGIDAEWHGARLGLGARGVWLDGAWRDRDWQRPLDAVRAIRLLELSGTAGDTALAVAGGGLAPAQIGHVADGHRAALDDRPRTGVRAAALGKTLELGAEIDDVLEPSLVGGGVAWQFAPPWSVRGAAAVDPEVSLAAIELALARRWDGARSRFELGGGVVGEPTLGAAMLAFAAGEIERGGARWSVTGEARAGSGTLGGAFGPLHRIERTLHDGTRGVGGAIALGVAGRPGWIRAGVRARPELGTLGVASAGAPMGRWLQAGAWFAAGPHATAGAAELRIAWTRRWSSVVELARMYDTDAMAPTPAWHATAWFGITAD